MLSDGSLLSSDATHFSFSLICVKAWVNPPPAGSTTTMTPRIMPQGLGFPARAIELRARPDLAAPPLPLTLGLLPPLLFVPLAMPVSDLVSYRLKQGSQTAADKCK